MMKPDGKQIAVLLILMCLAFIPPGNTQQDTLVFSMTQFLSQVRQEHPEWARAQLRDQYSLMLEQKARGLFDPEVSSDWRHKHFEGTPYYRAFEAEVRVPLWYSFDILGGYENIQGTYVNPERQTGRQGLWSAGIEARLGRGLMLDERRAAWKQAYLSIEKNEQEQALLINDLLAQAAVAYFHWQTAFEKWKLTRDNTLLAKQFFSSTRQLYLLGDKPAIDTLETFLWLRQQEVKLMDANLALISARQYLESFMWDGGTPASIGEQAIPESLVDPSRPTGWNAQWMEAMPENLPFFRMMDVQYRALELERKLKAERLKPVVNLLFTPLLATSETSIRPIYELSNFKWGFHVSMPLLYRGARAGVREMDLQMRDLDLEIQSKDNQYRNELQRLVQALDVILEQCNVINENVGRAQEMYDAEKIRFTAGESSVFLLNRRQEDYYTMRLSLLDRLNQANHIGVQLLQLQNKLAEYYNIQ